MRTLRLVLVLSSLAALAVFAAGASANGIFHTLTAPLSSVNGEPLQQGWVKDIHMNGNVNGAHEEYHLNGATPNTTYQVHIIFFSNDTTCSTTPADVPTAQLTTNGAGNANADFTFPASPPSPVAHDSAIWQLVDASGVAYQTSCQVVLIGG
jgi:hypothetical protein